MTAKPNILFLLSDEHSFRFLGHRPRENGGEDVATPTLDRLAAQGTVFESAYCGVPLCVPSRMTMMTGLNAPGCGAIDNFSMLSPDFETMPKMLGRAGYQTALVGKMHFGGNLQFHGFANRPYGDLMGTGIHQYEDDAWAADGKKTERNAGLKVEKNIGDNLISRTALVGQTRIPESLLCDNVVAEETLAFLRNQQADDADRPWFACASFSRPHFPLTAPARFAEKYRADNISRPFVAPEGASFDHPVSASIRDAWHVERIDDDEMMRARAGYFACVAYLDELLGDLLMRLEASGLLDNTIIVYASDHGEMAGELGTWWKSGWYEACTRVPLIVSTPAQRAGKQPARSVTTPVSLIDLAPTFASLAGASMAGSDGRDLSDAILSDGALADQPVFCDHINTRWGEGSEFRSMRWRNWKYVSFRNGNDLLFDLDADPDEASNLIAKPPHGVMEAFAPYKPDFAAFMDDLREEQRQLRDRFPLDKTGMTPNQYALSDGTIVSADTTIYKPQILTAEPDRFFGDWPGA